MTRNMFPLAGVVTAVLATAAMVPCLADTPAVSMVQVQARSIQTVPDFFGRTNDRIQMSARVNASDLNLADRSDVAKLRRRVWRAAQMVCTQIAERNPGLVDPTDFADRSNCVQNAVDDAMPQVRVAAVAARVRAGEALTSRAG